jgi:phospholipid/cholesterol/gamma-HCH transport system permease protein
MRYIGSMVSKFVLIELGPVLTALVVGGRVGARSRRARHDARHRADRRARDARDPAGALSRHAALPAATIMLPVVTVFADVIGILGGLVVANLSYDQSPHTY